jgi:hypothetical protein
MSQVLLFEMLGSEKCMIELGSECDRNPKHKLSVLREYIYRFRFNGDICRILEAPEGPWDNRVRVYFSDHYGIYSGVGSMYGVEHIYEFPVYCLLMK